MRPTWLNDEIFSGKTIVGSDNTRMKPHSRRPVQEEAGIMSWSFNLVRDRSPVGTRRFTLVGWIQTLGPKHTDSMPLMDCHPLAPSHTVQRPM
jgi:hypothetical protein